MWEIATANIESDKKEREAGAALRIDYNLKLSVYDKILDCHKGLQYTAFFNYRGNLCHVINPDDPDFIMRLRFKPSIKDIDPMKQLIMIWERLSPKLNLGPRPSEDIRERFVWPNNRLDSEELR